MANYNSRIQLKTDTALNWSKAVNFIPLKGEMIVYSDLNKFKIGDGITNVNDLEFANQQPQSDWEQVDDSALDYIKNKPAIATEDEILDLLVETDMIAGVTDETGAMLVDENENILTW